jgi:hypothetical protein
MQRSIKKNSDLSSVNSLFFNWNLTKSVQKDLGFKMAELRRDIFLQKGKGTLSATFSELFRS